MKSLAEFGRTVGSKDRQKRKSHLGRNLAIGASGLAALGGAAALAHHQGVFSNKIRNKRKIEKRKAAITKESDIRLGMTGIGVDPTSITNDSRKTANNIIKNQDPVWDTPWSTRSSSKSIDLENERGIRKKASEALIKPSAKIAKAKAEAKGRKYSAPMVYLNFF